MENKHLKKKYQGAISVFSMFFNSVLAYIFYQYAFHNPDDGSCWAINGNHVPSATKQAGYKNVSEQFVTWLHYGFIYYEANTVIAGFQLLCSTTED